MKTAGLKPKIVILHGWGHSKDHWKAFESYFEKDAVIALDLPGFGQEKLVSQDWGVPEYSSWAKAKIESLGEKNIVLLGHSFGGRIAGFIASQNPSWLKGLILYGSPSIYRPTSKIKFTIKAAKLIRRLGFLRKGADKMYPILKKVVIFDQTKTLPQIKVPTLLLWGERDLEVPLRIAEEMNALIPASKLIVLDKVGHNAHFENPNLFYGTVKTFIENL